VQISVDTEKVEMERTINPSVETEGDKKYIFFFRPK
jgi:hypothetical protein